MKRRRFFRFAAIAFLGLLWSGAARGQEAWQVPQSVSDCEAVGDYGVDACRSGGWFADVELLFTKFHQAHGVRTSDDPDPDNSAEFDLQLAPRLTLGYQRADGLGLRMNWWHYDDQATTFDDDSYVYIETDTLDLEAFQAISLTDCIGIDIFGGFRYTDLKQQDGEGLDYGFSGFGLTAGAEASRRLGFLNSRIYVRGRGSVVMGDGTLWDEGELDDNPQDFIDHVVVQTELALGWEASHTFANGTQFKYGIGAEFQDWSEAVIAGDDSEEANMYDAGWGGFVARMGLEF